MASPINIENHGSNNTIMVAEQNTLVNIMIEENGNQPDSVESTSQPAVKWQPHVLGDTENTYGGWIMNILNHVDNIDNAVNRNRISSSILEVYKQDVASTPRAKEPNNVLCLDCSQQMMNKQFENMIKMAHQFVDGVEKRAEETEQNIAVVCVSDGARVVQHLTCDFPKVRHSIDNLPHEGRCTFFEAVAVSLAAADTHDSEPGASDDRRSRLIFVTSGRPCAEQDGVKDEELSAISQMALFRFIRKLGEHPAYINRNHMVWVPVEGADMEFLELISKYGGVLHNAGDMKTLAKFFDS